MKRRAFVLGCGTASAVAPSTTTKASPVQGSWGRLLNAAVNGAARALHDPVKAPLPDGSVNVKAFPYNAQGDGITDDTAAVRAAIAAANALAVAGASYGGARIFLPAGQYKITSTLALPNSFVVLEGASRQGTLLAFSGMAAVPWIKIGTSGTASREQAIRNLSLVSGGSNSTTTAGDGTINGACIQIVNSHDNTVENVSMLNALCGVDVGPSTDAITLRDVTMTLDASLGVAGVNWHAPGDGTARSDVLALYNVTIAGQWSNATGIIWQGLCNTLDANGLRIEQMSIGMLIENPAQSSSYYPAFLNATGLEMEGFKTRALWIKGGTDFKIANSDISNLTGAASQGSADDAAILVESDVPYSHTRGLNLTQVRIGSCQQNGLYYKGLDLQMNGVIFFSTSAAGSGSYAAVRLGSTVTQANITNMIAEEFGGLAKASYGVQVDSGARGVLIDGLQVTYTQKGAVLDNSGGQTQVGKVAGTKQYAASSVIPGASPWTYTAGPKPETIYIYGGTVSAVTVAGQVVYAATGCTVDLPANGQVTVTYSVAPNVLKVPK